MTQPLVVVLDGPIVPMARPRVLHGRASNPRRSVEYQARLARAVRDAVAATGWTVPKGSVSVFVDADFPPRAADIDNIGKQALDALVRGGAIRDDRWIYVSRLEVRAAPLAPSRLTIEVTTC